jgi:DNA-directed RNA polymerase specialized sigma24 family protein
MESLPMQPATGASAPADSPIYYLTEDAEGAQTFDAVDPSPGPADVLDQFQVQVAVDNFVAALPEFERRVVLGVFYGDLSQSEVAHILGVNKMAVSRALAAVRAKGRVRLRDFDPGGDPQ